MTATTAEVDEYNRRTSIMAEQFVFTGENPDDALRVALAEAKESAGFSFDSIDDGTGFLQVHRFKPVGPAASRK